MKCEKLKYHQRFGVVSTRALETKVNSPNIKNLLSKYQKNRINKDIKKVWSTYNQVTNHNSKITQAQTRKLHEMRSNLKYNLHYKRAQHV